MHVGISHPGDAAGHGLLARCESMLFHGSFLHRLPRLSANNAHLGAFHHGPWRVQPLNQFFRHCVVLPAEQDRLLRHRCVRFAGRYSALRCPNSLRCLPRWGGGTGRHNPYVDLPYTTTHAALVAGGKEGGSGVKRKNQLVWDNGVPFDAAASPPPGTPCPATRLGAPGGAPASPASRPHKRRCSDMPPTADGVPDLAELLAQPSIGCRALETFYSPIGHTLSNSMVATVHCVTCLQTGQACCVKVTRKRAVLGALDLRALEREAVLHRQLEHPNIVRLLDAFETRDTFQVVMEYVPGRSLAGHLACCLFKRMDEGATRMLFRQLLRAVAHAHERNVVHCDINVRAAHAHAARARLR